MDASISSAAVATSDTASCRDCIEEAMLSMNSSAVTVMLTDELRRLSVVSCISAIDVASCLVIG